MRGQGGRGQGGSIKGAMRGQGGSNKGAMRGQGGSNKQAAGKVEVTVQ